MAQQVSKETHHGEETGGKESSGQGAQPQDAEENSARSVPPGRGSKVQSSTAAALCGKEDRMRWILIIFTLFLAGCQSQLDCSWKQAHEAALAGNAVRLTLTDVGTPNGESFQVVLKDDRQRHVVANAAFYVQNPSTFLFDLSPVLKDMKQPPSSKAVIVLIGENGVKVKCARITIEIVK